jgi:hypothetical protein
MNRGPKKFERPMIDLAPMTSRFTCCEGTRRASHSAGWSSQRDVGQVRRPRRQQLRRPDHRRTDTLSSRENHDLSSLKTLSLLQRCSRLSPMMFIALFKRTQLA